MLTRGVLVLLASFACSGEPKRSFCEALCDWAVECQATERTVEADAMLESCLTATRASDASCEKAESGTMDPASAKLLEPCVNAIDTNAGEADCNGFVGTIDQLKTAAVPAECATQADDAVATFDAARDATVETGEQLCNRYTTTFCGRSEECILGDFGGQIPQEATDALGTPFDRCVEGLTAAFTNTCVSSDLYHPEEDFTDANIARQSARTCLADFSTVTCDALFDGNLENTSLSCTTSVSSPDDLLAIGGVLFDLAEEFAQYAR